MKLSHVAVLAWAVCLAPVVIAAETSTTTVSPDGRTTVIKVIRHGAGGDTAPSAGDPAISSHCAGDAQKTETDSETKTADGKTVRTRIMMCAKGKADPAQQLSGLKQAREQIAKDENIPAEAREKALASIDARIAALSSDAQHNH